jgi:hypothetical protein
VRTTAGATNLLYSDNRVVELTDRMLEAGTGLRAQALFPPPAIVDLAAWVVSGDSPGATSAPRSSSSSTASSTWERRSGITVSGAPAPMSSESYRGCVLTERHPTEALLGYLHTVRQVAVETVLDTGVSRRDFMII